MHPDIQSHYDPEYFDIMGLCLNVFIFRVGAEKVDVAKHNTILRSIKNVIVINTK